MARRSLADTKRYDSIESDGCVFCTAPGDLVNIYHPNHLPEGHRGVHVKSCKSCYSTYKTRHLDSRPFEIVKNYLVTRQRRFYRPRNCNTPYEVLQERYYQGLDVFFGPSGEVVAVMDQSGMSYDLKDVEKFISCRAGLMNMSKEQVEDFCKKNFTDQRFIIKVVSSFSS